MPITTAPLFTLFAQVNSLVVTGIPQGDRVLFDVVGGQFSGPKLSGRVLPSGGDWLTLSAAGARLDVRLVLETHDGVTILLRYTGVGGEKNGQQRADVAGLFEAPEGPYGWLNGILAVGHGGAVEGGGSYEFFEVV